MLYISYLLIGNGMVTFTFQPLSICTKYFFLIMKSISRFWLTVCLIKIPSMLTSCTNIYIFFKLIIKYYTSIFPKKKICSIFPAVYITPPLPFKTLIFNFTLNRYNLKNDFYFHYKHRGLFLGGRGGGIVCFKRLALNF